MQVDWVACQNWDHQHPGLWYSFSPLPDLMLIFDREPLITHMVCMYIICNVTKLSFSSFSQLIYLYMGQVIIFTVTTLTVHQ